jgi:DNA invertase Pin-like site-specific DNA recombinase
MLVGYMRTSSHDSRQIIDLQREALLAAGVDPRHLFEDAAGGIRKGRTGLEAALGRVRTGDCLIVWRLDRLGRSLPHLVQVIMMLREKGVGFRSLAEQMDTTADGALLFGFSGRSLSARGR